MHVTRVELENIKCHAHAEFTFERGTTAITGENGAGKTTILEAIAWALFDTLEYSKDDFLRRGAKKGVVRVTFESDLDERQYMVYRDTGNGYYVFDHGLNMRIAEKKTDVAATLRQHLGIEPGTDLKGLFRSAIGVPQGTFTADFLRTATERKASFDRLLKVEEYREGAERLRDTVNLIRERAAEVRGRISGAESQLARYDELVLEHTTAAARTLELSASLAHLQQETEQRAAVVHDMDAAEQSLNETRSLRDRLEVEQDAAARRLRDVTTERDAALRATERAQAVEESHRVHLIALDVLRQLETERAERELLRTEAGRIAHLQATAAADVRRIEEALERAISAGAKAASLETEIKEQEALERERERLRDLRAQALSARSRLAKLDTELEALRAQHAQTQKRVKEAQSGEGAPARVEKLESERIGVENTLSRASEAATSLKHLQDQRKESAREAERLRALTASLEKEISELETFSARAAQATELDTRLRTLTERAASLRAEITRDERMRVEVKGGLCPILSERCLNIGEGQTLEGYFTDHLTANTAELGALETEHAGVVALVRDAREAEKHFSRIERARLELAGGRELLSTREATLARVDTEITGLPPAGTAHLKELRLQLFGIDAELKDARAAALKHAELQPLRQRLKEIEAEGIKRRDERAEIAAAAEALNALESDITENEKHLRFLNDPRGRAGALRTEAELEAQLKRESEGARDALRALDEQAQDFAAKLNLYDQLDARWEETRARRDQTIDAHREYVSSQSLAATLPARETEVQKAAHEASHVTQEAKRAGDEYSKLAAAYKREQHITERNALSLSREQTAATRAQLDAAETRAASLSAELERLAKVRDEMRAEFLEKERLERLNEATDFIRDVLKQAGPLVTESYLYNVSIEANQLFREITGEAGRALRWTRDYEIVLEEEGHERSFQNLSGGEQMAAALSVRLALLKQLSDIRLAFFDEPTTNMDAERRERLAQQIGQVRHFDQLFVISHDDTFEEAVDHIVHVERASDSSNGDHHQSDAGNDADGDANSDEPRPRRKRARAESVAQQA